MRPKFSLRLPKDPRESRAAYIVAGVLQLILLIAAASFISIPLIHLVDTWRDQPHEVVTPIPLRFDSTPPKRDRSTPTPKAPRTEPPGTARSEVPTLPPTTPPPAPPVIAPPVTVPSTLPPVVGDTDRRIVGRGLIPQLSPHPLPIGPVAGPPVPMTEFPRNPTPAAVADVWIRQYWDSLATEQAKTRDARDPMDWTTTRGSGKYGVDPQFIYFGKYKLPTVLLALLPINVQANTQSWERNRLLGELRRDIAYHAMRAQSQAEFDKSVKELRARKERERIEAEKKKAAAGVNKPPPDR